MCARSQRTDIPTKELPPAVARALEFDGGRGVNAFRAITGTSHDFLIASQVYQHYVIQRKKLDFAIDDVAREHPVTCTLNPKCETISRTTVGRYWDRYRSRLVSQSSPEA